MEPRTCSICGSRIVNHRCTGCGMYIGSTEGKYYLNVQRPEDKKASKEKYRNEQKEAEDHRRSRIREEMEARRLEKERQEHTRENLNRQSSRHTDACVHDADTNRKRQYGREDRDSSSDEFRWSEPQAARYNRKMKGKSVTKHTIAAILGSCVVAFGIFTEIFEDKLDATTNVFDSFSNIVSDDSETYEEEGDIYADVTRDLAEDGETFSTTLQAGYYVVGQQIPEGKYRITADSELMQFHVEDYENNIFNTWWMSVAEPVKEDDELYSSFQEDDIRLYAGARVRIVGEGTMKMETENGQTQDLSEPAENSLTETITVGPDTLEAGTDYPAGWYDIQVVSGEGEVSIEYGGEYGSIDSLYLAEDSPYESAVFRNVYLEDGSTIHTETYADDVDCTVKLVPCEQIYE